MLQRLAQAFDRLTEPPAVRCAACGVPMVLQRESPVGEVPGSLQRAYACERCGYRTTRCVVWAIPD
jgi:DNA-directed RNA polymerase subunit RPC12/RpoP